jgi:hypothetical protein
MSHLQFVSIEMVLEQQTGKHCLFLKYQFEYFSMMQQSLVDMALVVNM